MSAVPRTLTADDLPGTEELLHQAGSENFTVANRLLGAETCRHLLAIYGYARLVDDVGDEAPAIAMRCSMSWRTSCRRCMRVAGRCIR